MVLTQEKKKKIRFWALNGLLTAFFAFIMLFGESFQRDWSWNAVMIRPVYSTVSFFCWWISLFWVSYFLGRPFVLEEKKNAGGRFYEWLAHKRAFRKCFLLAWGLMMLLWLPYLVGFYPAIANFDVAEQIAMSFNMENSLFKFVEQPLSEHVLNSGHHPVFHTGVLGFFVRLGEALGSQNVGMFFLAFLQAAFTSGVFSWSVCDMGRRGVSFGRCLLLFLFLSLIPTFPLYAINLVKNSIYSAWAYLSVILFLHLAEDKEAFCRSKKRLAFLSLSLFMQMLNVKHGVHVVILTAAPLLIYYRKQWKRLVPVFVVPVLLVQIGVNGILMPALKIPPGSDREKYGFMYQQTARYLRDYPQDVTEEEREAIDRVLIYDKVVENYSPITSDPVKGYTYRKGQTKEDRAAYQRAWFGQFLKHPGVYVEATINGCYGFFYPGTDEWYNYYEFDRVIEQRGDGFFEIYHPEELKGLKDGLTRLEAFVRELPVVRILFRHATYVWVTLWCAMIFLASGRYKSFLAVLPLIGNILVCILSPYNANTRYLLPVIYGAGLCVLALYGNMDGGKRDVSCTLEQ